RQRNPVSNSTTRPGSRKDIRTPCPVRRLTHRPARRRVQSTSRAVVIRSGGTARIWSRQRNDLTDGFRDIAAAAVSQLPDGVEVNWSSAPNGRLDFAALQKRLV